MATTDFVFFAKLIYFLHLLNLNVTAHWATPKTNNEMPKGKIRMRRLCKSQWSINGACLAAKVCNSIRQAHFFSKFLWSLEKRLANLSIVICYGNHFKIVLVLFFLCNFFDLIANTILDILALPLHLAINTMPL